MVAFNEIKSNFVHIEHPSTPSTHECTIWSFFGKCTNCQFFGVDYYFGRQIYAQLNGPRCVMYSLYYNFPKWQWQRQRQHWKLCNKFSYCKIVNVSTARQFRTWAMDMNWQWANQNAQMGFIVQKISNYSHVLLTHLTHWKGVYSNVFVVRISRPLATLTQHPYRIDTCYNVMFNGIDWKLSTEYSYNVNEWRDNV